MRKIPKPLLKRWICFISFNFWQINQKTLFHKVCSRWPHYIIKKIILAYFNKIILPIFWNVSPIFGQFFFAQNRPKWKFYYGMWLWGTNYMKYFCFIYGSKIEAYEANSTLQIRFCDFFSQRGYVFGFYWD